MIRHALILAAAVAIAGPAFAGEPVALRATLVSHGSQVTLADLFDGATGPAGKVVVAAASGAGFNTVLDASKVQLAAHGAGLDWDNAQGQRRIVVASAGAAPDRTPERPVERAAAAARAPRAAQALAYARNMAAGEIVQASDLIWSSEVIAPAGAPGDPDAVIGQAARRPLRGGAAVLSSDVVAPVAVHRDETISVAYEAPGMTLVLQGKVLKDAAIGDSVQVMNPQSKKIIEAVVSGPGRAMVGPRAEALKARAFSTASLR